MTEKPAGRAETPFDVTLEEGVARFEVTLHPLPDAPGADALSHSRHLFDNPDEHVHPEQEERIEVLSGTYGVAIEGTEHTLREGDGITVPPNTPHRQWNPLDRPIRVAHEHRPPRQSAEIYETLFALAQAGLTDEKGLPNWLRFAVVSRAHPGHVYSAALPVPVQKAGFALLAPLGRLAGYEASLSREELPD